MNKVKFTKEQLEYLEEIFAIPCCHVSGTHDPIHYQERKYICGIQYREALKGRKSSNWKGGKLKHCGYILILKKNHPFCDSKGYVREHRLVIEKIIGRYLKPEEVVHHANRIRDDNCKENLICFRNILAHKKFHWNKNINPSDIIFDGRIKCE